MTALNWAAAEAALTASVSWCGDEPGGAVLLFDRDGLRAVAAGGVESLATLAPFSIDTVVRYASVTKHVFASFVLAHPELISLSDPLGKHLPGLAPATAEVTVGQALDMSGGLPDSRECLTLIGLSIFTETRAPELLAFHEAMTRLNYPAGTEVHYSNGGYRLVEEAMRAHGLKFDDFLRRELREGRGIAMQAAEMWTDPVKGLATGYWHDGASWQMGLQGMHLSAAGSLIGSGRALADWGRALLRAEGSFAGRLAALSAPRHLADGRTTGYGLGLRRQQVGTRELIGHGGSQPGFKSYLLLDPETGIGCAVVSNRDETNGSAIAAQVLAALFGEHLPEPGSDLVPGLYVAPEGADWIEVRAASVVRLDDEVAVYPVAGGGVDSLSPTSRLELRMDGAAVVGETGHAPARFLPVRPEPIPADLDGLWHVADLGGALEIRDGAVIMGAGPTRRVMPLQSLGGGRFLFTLRDGPWLRRICLARDGDDAFDLVLSRARMIRYTRQS
ncbi:serine hydrolase domain-containing protein [Paracoccus aminophilus]|uniref:Penicillin binding protein n=1 Tax=Paracoccus aminophilus JCM 7686 TaxID=1367847 RepID=S5Y6P8_PARAH|nr:serine hydrolase domain-containing protein [Paracoccus aminophilus]AGT11270.1 penicillin binding protein [Paracoccus aminophilus JCM 7686]